MKELSHESLSKIRSLIHGQNYANIKARVNQLIDKEYADTFANISIFGPQAIWYGDEHTDYRPYSEANDRERDEIAIWLEGCRDKAIEVLSTSMPYIDKMFQIPDKESILWYRTADGQVRVTLTHWGFMRLNDPQDIDIISVLIKQPRTIQQDDVTIHIAYSDGMEAVDTPFRLYVFNNEKALTTDENANYHLGKIFEGKTFAVADENGNNYQDFTVTHQGTYNAVFDYTTTCDIRVVNQHGEAKPDCIVYIDGKEYLTDEQGLVRGQKLMQGTTTITAQTGPAREVFTLSREPEQNHFEIKIEDEVKKDDHPKDPIIPDPPVDEKIRVIIRDYDGTPLPELPFDLVEGKTVITSGVTGEDGSCLFDKAIFPKSKKAKIKFIITKEYRKRIDQAKKDSKK